jgi:hypothetical protein
LQNSAPRVRNPRQIGSGLQWLSGEFPVRNNRESSGAKQARQDPATGKD